MGSDGDVLVLRPPLAARVGAVLIGVTFPVLTARAWLIGGVDGSPPPPWPMVIFMAVIGGTTVATALRSRVECDLEGVLVVGQGRSRKHSWSDIVDVELRTRRRWLGPGWGRSWPTRLRLRSGRPAQLFWWIGLTAPLEPLEVASEAVEALRSYAEVHDVASPWLDTPFRAYRG